MTPAIETIGGTEFGRCGSCGGRMDAQRAKDGLGCNVCTWYGPRRRPIRPGLRFRVVAGRTEVVVDERAARRLTEKGERFGG